VLGFELWGHLPAMAAVTVPFDAHARHLHPKSVTVLYTVQYRIVGVFTALRPSLRTLDPCSPFLTPSPLYARA
jgi:hypothetical protein